MKSTIKSWSDDDKPREKLVEKGVDALSTAELLAILLGSGSRGESAVDLAKRLLHDVDDDLLRLGTHSIFSLMEYKGIGQAKAVTIQAALELGKRRKTISQGEEPSYQSSHSIYLLFEDHFMDHAHEEAWIVYLNRGLRLLGKEKISLGGSSATIIDPKIVFKKSLDRKAHYIVLIHNHPSGNTKPSTSDIQITQQIAEAGALLNLPLLDHLIISKDSYFSFKDEGLLG